MKHLLSLFVLALLITGCAHAPAPPANQVYQTSTITALLDGIYDGDLSLAELRERGDFGLGTFNDVDGEMVLLDGRFYQVRADGKAYRPPLDARSPLAVVTFFRPTQALELQQPLSYEALQARLDALRSTHNVPLAFRVDGEFELVRTRSVPRQSPPYRRLVEVTKEQPTFEFRSVRGTLVGFWMPQYMQQVNVPGYHLHFITADRSAGGHVLDCRPRKVRVEWAELPQLLLRLPATASFRSAALGEQRRGELHAVEQAATRPASK